MKQNTVDPDFDCFGWISKVQLYRGTSKLTIKSQIVVALELKKGQPLHCYLLQDSQAREIVVTYLDGQPDEELEQAKVFSWRTCVQKGGRRSYRLTISKTAAIGAGFRRSKELFSYTARIRERAAMIVYLDGNPRHNAKGGDFKWRKEQSTSTGSL